MSARQTNARRSHLLRLPRELLQMILYLSAPLPVYRRFHHYGSARYSDDRESYLIPWLKLGHVCSELRETLLAMRQLWAEVAFLPHGLDAAQEYARRAADNPLSILVFSESKTISDAFIDFLQSCLAKARHVEITSTQVLSRMTDELQSLHLPVAERLVLDNRKYVHAGSTVRITHMDWKPHQDVAQESFVAITKEPEPIFAPCLKCLHLFNIVVPFDPSHLVELRLQMPKSGEDMWSAYILAMLRRSPNLHTLEISDMMFNPHSATTARIPLPSLQDLFMLGENECILWLWSQIIIPSSVVPEVAIGGDLDLQPSVWDTINALSEHVCRGRGARPVSGCSFVIDPFQYHLRLIIFTATGEQRSTTDEHRFSPFHQGHQRILDVLVVCDMDIDSLHDNISRLCDLFGLAAVEKLEMGTLERVDECDEPFDTRYSQWLSAFPNVHTLCLHHFPFPVSGPDGDSKEEHQPDFALLYPSLESLAILHLSLDEGELDEVVRMVGRRVSADLSLRELKIASDGTWEPDGMAEESTLSSLRATLENLVPSVEFGT
ncbi:unnamed protein product [Peniophora sp. CBMAI 1063]|nr:unnamed protein product [Peniophora sp. CBMAI 1063]